MLTLLLAYILLGILFYVEHRYESSPRTTASVHETGDDQGTSRLLLMVWILCGFVSPLVWLSINVGAGPGWIGWIGLGWIIGGIVLLRWSIFVNTFYIRAMATNDDQYICTEGPYKVVRHPGYAAFIVGWLGFGLATCNWWAFLTTLVLTVYAYVKRILAEEQMMLDKFSVDYQQYVNESSRLIPFVF
ncbi:hypothetical protein INT45_004640 [Circinella minor]|uniref:Protein-S-isoprenylcysteine O-methyltransferase n=1 Tax=Circinella minor TaxID=1195481 RepID=A0A8H7VJN0_9FUNG|nr:hypothetical protein INT45_004640 [Circinella minor]